MTMWGGRFQSETSGLFKKLNDSLPVDYQLAEQDIQGSIAWSEALMAAGVLTVEEQSSLQQALEELAEDVRLFPERILDADAEDIHSWVEQALIKKVGALGKKLHTGRSRNDQVLTDVKLWCRQEVKKIQQTLGSTIDLLEKKSEEFATFVMPSYTHLQRAQPITFGYWLHAVAQMLIRDNNRLSLLNDLANESPLGASAICGTAFNIDRDHLARQLNFSSATTNALDTVSDRDFILDLLYCSSTSLLHLSRVAEDLIFFNSQESSFVLFGDSVTSGSSLMPQKKNPDALELIRGKSAECFGLLSQMMMAIKSLPMGYNKDLQQDKVVLFQSLKSWQDSLLMLQQVFYEVTPNQQNMREAVEQSFSNATELADYLVSKGVPFRDAHQQTGQLVLLAERKSNFLGQLSISDFQSVNPAIDMDVYKWLEPEAGILRRQVKGGVGTHWSAYTSSGAKSEYRIEVAQMGDLDALSNMIKYWSDRGENLPRKKNNIAVHLTGFKVIKDRSNQLLACGELHIYDKRLAEIRSLGVEPAAHGNGLGKRLVAELLRWAKTLELSSVFVLTRNEPFFFSCGFEAGSIDDLPTKVLKDCQYCPRQDKCDEVAMIYPLKSGSL